MTASSAPPLSLRAYARHRQALKLPGDSAVAVSRAIKSGRLRACLVRDEKGDFKIADPEAADREWAAHTDHSRAPAAVKELAGNQPRQVRANTDAAADPIGDTLADASNREKHWKAKKAELDFRRVAGELVPAADVARELTTAAANIRTKVLGVPSKLKARHPRLELDLVADLDTLLREALADLATLADGEHVEAIEPNDLAEPAADAPESVAV